MFETRVEIVSDYSISDLETKINAALKRIREDIPMQSSLISSRGLTATISQQQ